MKKAKYIVVTILLGALGSAFWEVCLKRFALLFIDWLIPYFLQCFNDSFYTRVSISLNATSFYSFSYIMAVLMLLITIPPKRFYNMLHSYQKEKRERILQSIFKFTYLLVIAYNYLIISLASTIARDTITNIEIVAPYITDMDYKQLRSEFFQMDSKSDYEDLVNKISTIAEFHNLQLN